MSKDIKLTYDDVMIVPEAISNISSRSECNPYDDYGMLPIFTAPMSTVIDENNYKLFIHNGIHVVIPRTVDLRTRIEIMTKEFVPFVAMSIVEAREFFLEKKYDFYGAWLFENNKGHVSRLCIDVANGHMFSLLELVKELKAKFGDTLEIMTGNIANPNTIRYYDMAGVDYCRVSIGTGSGCLTASNTGIYYPQFSLLEEIYNIKKEENLKCKIVADGGIRGFRDIQKALIFADYVMVGGLFNKFIESAGETTYGKFYFTVGNKKFLNPIKTLLYTGRKVKKVTNKLISDVKSGKVELFKEFYGMSTKKAQCAMGSTKLKTSEGIVKKNKVEFDIAGWVENETDYLKSAMSYTNSRTLEDYKGSEYIVMDRIQFNN